MTTSLTSMAACPSAPVSSCGRIKPGDDVCFANIWWFSWRCGLAFSYELAIPDNGGQL
jgi:hypothetical protein